MIVQPTPAFTRALGLAAGLGAVAVLLAKPVAAVLAVPFVVYVAWALVTRPDRREVAVDVTPRLVAVREHDPSTARGGSAVPLQLTTDAEPGYVAVAWPLRFGLALDPADGALVVADTQVLVVAEPRTWGRYQVGPPEVSVVDVSGAWRAAGEGPVAGVVVRPAALELQGASGVARPIGVAGAHNSRTVGDGTSLADLREFRLGDRLRRVNWRVTSRTGRLHVNETFRERDTEVLVVVDSLHDVPAATSSDATSLDLGVRAAAAVARHYLGFGDRVALHDVGRRMRQVRAGSGARQLQIVVDALSRIERKVAPAYGGRRLHDVRSDTLVFFCSPFVDEFALEQLGHLHRLGAEVVAIDTLPASVGDARRLRGGSDRTYLPEAWVVRRLEREVTFGRLRAQGVPVVAWRGTSSLAGVLLAMEAARRAPRLVRR